MFPYRDALRYEVPRSGITITDDGEDIASAQTFVWTGGDKAESPNGEQFQCRAWKIADATQKGTVGNAATPNLWMNAGSMACSEHLRIYCIEVP